MSEATKSPRTAELPGLGILRDELTRRLYANDASMYEELPEAVAFPRNGEDLAELVHLAKAQKTSITVRAAGTSLAGQTTGGGIIADTSRFMNRILDIDPDAATATVEPGVIRDALNREALVHGLRFGPDTSTTNRCMMGGMIGNNSAGLYSLKHGSTRDHIISVHAVLSDGSRAVFGPLSPAELKQKMQPDNLEGNIYRETITLLKQHKDAISKAFPHPEIRRRNTGYALDSLCGMDPITPGGRPFNLAELLCGSEGTLALTEKAVVRLVPAEPVRVLLIPHFHTLDDAMRATVLAVDHKPAAVELIDDIILNATKGNIEQQRNRFFLKDDPKCLLIIEFEGYEAAGLLQQAQQAVEAMEQAGLGYAFPLIDDPEQIKRVWNLRKAGLGLLMGLSTDARTPTFAEDTAVRVAELPNYVRDFQALMKKYDTSCVFYAHASVGELHLRPAIDISSEQGLRKMEQMAEEVAELVKSYRGSLSGEHGDGRARAPFIRRVIGDEMVGLLEQIKHIWDPENIFNPGKIVHPRPMRQNLRPSSQKQTKASESIFNWTNEGGFREALQLCNGAGVCRKQATSGGTMCPSYMATLDEKDSTRGRANLFRQLFNGRDTDAFESDDLKEALRYCLSCKACKSECPANVDMARMKAEFMSGWHRKKGIPLSTRFWANPVPILRLGARFPKLSNRIAGSSAGHFVMESLFGLHPDRPLPEFSEQSFEGWLKRNFTENRDLSKNSTGPEVLLLIDPFTNLNRPSQAIAAIRVLEKLGCRLLRPLIKSTGRTMISSGLPEKAVPVLNELANLLEEPARRGAWIVGLEPSELLTLRDEFTDLKLDAKPETIRKISSQALLFEEFTDGIIEAEHITGLSQTKETGVMVHAHCYVKALTGTSALLSVLHKAGFNPEETDSGCCGMAGSFGYKSDTYELSVRIGEQRLLPKVRSLEPGALICAHGFSCQHQIKDGTGHESFHPAELLHLSIFGHSCPKRFIKDEKAGIIFV